MPKQTFSIPFTKGLDTESDPFQVQAPALTTLQNLLMFRTGSLDKRPGYDALSSTVIGSNTPITKGVALNTLNDQMLLFDGLHMYSRLSSQNAWVNKGSCVSVIQTNSTIARNANQQLSPDFGSYGGIDVYAWEDSSGGILYSVLESATGTIILDKSPLYTGAPSTLYRPKVIPFAAMNLIVIFFTNNAGQILCVPISPSKASTVNTAAITLVNNCNIPTYYDVCTNPVNNVLLLTWQGTVAGAPSESRVFLGKINPIGVSVIQTVFVATTFTPQPTGCLNVYADTTYIYVSYGAPTTPTTVFTSAYNINTMSTAVFPTQTFSQAGVGAVQSIGMVGTTTGTVQIYAEYQGNTSLQDGYALIYQNTLGTSLSSPPASNGSLFVRSVGLASKPFAYNGNIYLNVAFQSNLQATYYTIDSSGTVISKVHKGLGGGLINQQDYLLPECLQTSPGVFQYANSVKGLPNSEQGVIFALLGVNGTKLDFADTDKFRASQMAQSLYIVGGVLQRYDGARLYEHNYNYYPEGITTTSSGSGGNLGTGSYQYLITYLQVDNNGLPDESTPSPATTVVFASGTTNQVSLTIPTLRLTRKAKVQIVVYRTTANGSLFYRVTSALLPTYNDPTVDTITFVDPYADTTIQSNGLCYTQPNTTGVNPLLTNDGPPSCSLITTYAQRIFLGGLDDPNSLAFSNQLTPNLPMQFSDELTLSVPNVGGKITAIKELQGLLIVFEENGIYYIQGQGPDATGNNNDLTTFVRIPTNVGCASQDSVIETPLGLFFQASHNQGLYLLDRSLNVSPKGASMLQFNSLNINSAELYLDKWVVFLTDDSSTNGYALYYDYYHDLWGTFANHAGLDSVNWLGDGNTYCYLRPNGQVYVLNRTSYSDAGQVYYFDLVSAWINPSILQGYQRVCNAYLLGKRYGNATLLAQVGFDADESFENYAYIPVDSVAGSANFGITSPYGTDPFFGGAQSQQTLFQYRLDIQRNCQSVRFRLTDREANPGNQAFSLSAIGLTLMLKKGFRPISPYRQFGT